MSSYVQIMAKVTPAIVMKWTNLAKELAPNYPSMNKGYPTARMRVYAAIADRYGVHPRTVARCLSPTTRKRAYARERGRLTRNLDLQLQEIWNGDIEMPVRDISMKLQEKTGVFLGESVLERILSR